MPASKKRRASNKHVAVEVRERVPTHLFVDWNLAIAMGKDARLEENEDGELEVVWPDSGGVVPPLERRDAAIRRLEDRGFGSVPTVVALEASLRASNTGDEIPVEKLGPKTSIALAELLGLALHAPPSLTPASNADDNGPAPIDVEAHAVPAVPAGTDVGMSKSDESAT
jgi:hypothetical protein